MPAGNLVLFLCCYASTGNLAVFQVGQQWGLCGLWVLVRANWQKSLVPLFRATPTQIFLVLAWFASPDSIVGFCSFCFAGEVQEREFENLSTSHITIQSSRRAFGARLIEALAASVHHL